MSLGLFDIVGPVMHGPSSNHTGGATRIGYLAGKLMGDVPRRLTFSYHPIFMNFFAGQRSNVAMMAGCLGMREYDEEFNSSLEMAARRGVSVDYTPIEEPDASRDTMRVSATLNGIDWRINGLSIGGGNIIIDSINHVTTYFDGNGHITLFLLEQGTDCTAARAAAAAESGNFKEMFCGDNGRETVLALDSFRAFSPETHAALEQIFAGRILHRAQVEPLYVFAERSAEPPLFDTFEGMLKAAQGRSLADAAIALETRRSKTTAQQVLNEGLYIVKTIDASMRRGLLGDNPLVGGLCTGNDGKLVWDHSGSADNICGSVFNRGLARALAMAEINASAGLVVAAPTAGSAGTLPATLFTVAERYERSSDELARAFLIAAAVGVVIGRLCSFSGGTTGCQSEVGIGAALGAAGSVYLAGGSNEAAIHAAALALKNVQGLSCDCPASPVEIPCIKRNAMGVSVALMASELALAGVRSVLPPDDIVIAFADTQKWMPTELCNANIGGLAATPYAKVLKEKWNKRLEEIQKKINEQQVAND